MDTFALAKSQYDRKIEDLEKRVAHLESLLRKAEMAMKRFESHPMFGTIVRMFKE